MYHADMLRRIAGEIEAIDTSAAAALGVSLRDTADEFERTLLKLDSLQGENEGLLRYDDVRRKALLSVNNENLELRSRLDQCESALRGLVDVHENAKGPESMIALDAARAYLRSAVEKQQE